MDFSFWNKYSDFFIEGVKLTILLSLGTIILSVVCGILLALMKRSRIAPLRWVASTYIEIIRGTPILLQVYIIFFGLPYLNINLPDYVSGVMALTINSSAYVAEIFRAGIQAVDKGQMEAARSLGMPQRLAMTHIILPQAVRKILPALGNEFVVVIKESSIVSVVGLHELMFGTKNVVAGLYRPFEPLLIAAAMYFVLTFTLTKLLGVAERRMSSGD